MKRFGLVLVCAVVSALLVSQISLGQKSSGSSGRSYSSGSSSSGSSRSYSSGSSSGSSRSYSSGGSSGSSGRSYSSGGGSSSSSKPSSSGSLFGGSGSKPSASSGSKSYSSGSSKPSASPSPSGKSYSSGSSSSGGEAAATSSSSSTKPKSSNFNADMSRAAREDQSRTAYKQATAPKPTYTDSKGATHKIDPGDKNVEHVRTITHEKYVTRETRVRTFYEPYYGRPVTYYSDPFGPFFYLWLFDRCSTNDRALWAYNHRSEMDDARWRDMCAKDAKLEARVKQLEAEKQAKVAGYVPPGLPPDQVDLMYNDQFVDASYNPEAVEAEDAEGIGVGWVLFWVLLTAVVVGGGVYLIFIKDYERF